MKPFVFRVHRTRVAGKTAEIRLEPITDDQVIHLNDGDELITGALTVNPWESE